MGRCPICFLQNISLIRLVVLEKKIFEGFLPYLGMAAILNSDQNHFSYFSFPQCLDATYEICLHLAQWFQRRRRLKVWTDDGRTTGASHTKSSPGAFGSGGGVKTPIYLELGIHITLIDTVIHINKQSSPVLISLNCPLLHNCGDSEMFKLKAYSLLS